MQPFANASKLPRVRIIQGRFENLVPHDCFVTAGNAFGMMTAGIDVPVVMLHTGQACHNVVVGLPRPAGNITWISINSEPLLFSLPGWLLHQCAAGKPHW